MTPTQSARLDILTRALRQMGCSYVLGTDEVRLVAASGLVIASTNRSEDLAADLEMLGQDFAMGLAMTGRFCPRGEA
jgi:hypothetical protein